MQVNREYEDLRGDGQIMLFLRNEGKKPNVRLTDLRSVDDNDLEKIWPN